MKPLPKIPEAEDWIDIDRFAHNPRPDDRPLWDEFLQRIDCRIIPASPESAWWRYRLALSLHYALPKWRDLPPAVRTAWVAALSVRYDVQDSWQIYRRTLHYQQLHEDPEAAALPEWHQAPRHVRAAFNAAYPARPINGGPPHLRRKPPVGQWIAQPKFNGWRALVHLRDGGPPEVWNRRGEPLSIAGAFQEALHDLAFLTPAGSWLDCEALERRGQVSGTLIVLDWIPARGLYPPGITYAQRRRALMADTRLPVLHWHESPPSMCVRATDEIYLDHPDHPAEPTLADVCAELARINQARGDEIYEGVVCKRLDSPYPVQRRSPDERCPHWIKHRFDTAAK